MIPTFIGDPRGVSSGRAQSRSQGRGNADHGRVLVEAGWTARTARAVGVELHRRSEGHLLRVPAYALASQCPLSTRLHQFAARREHTPGCAARGPLSSPVTGDPGSQSCERQCRRQIRTSWHGALWPSGSDRGSTDQDGDCHVPGTTRISTSLEPGGDARACRRTRSSSRLSASSETLSSGASGSG